MYKLTRYETDAAAAVNEQHLWPVRFVALNSVDDTPAKIFVMQEAAPDEFASDTFSCVASAVQMYDLPEDAPSTEGPYFRVNDVTIMARSATASEELIEKIECAVQTLANNMEASLNLSVAEEITIEPHDHVPPFQ